MPDIYLFALIFGAIVAGIYLERGRAKWSRREWQARRKNKSGRSGNSLQMVKSDAPLTDAAEQLRVVIGASFEKRRLLSRSEARVLHATEKAIGDANLSWRVMAQVSLGEVLSSKEPRAYAAINSKRVDLLVISNDGDPIAAIEYQGDGHYQGSAPARDAVKKEALRKAGIRYLEVTPEHGPRDVAREISRIAGRSHMGVERVNGGGAVS